MVKSIQAIKEQSEQLGRDPMHRRNSRDDCGGLHYGQWPVCFWRTRRSPIRSAADSKEASLGQWCWRVDRLENWCGPLRVRQSVSGFWEVRDRLLGEDAVQAARARGIDLLSLMIYCRKSRDMSIDIDRCLPIWPYSLLAIYFAINQFKSCSTDALCVACLIYSALTTRANKAWGRNVNKQILLPTQVALTKYNLSYPTSVDPKRVPTFNWSRFD